MDDLERARRLFFVVEKRQTSGHIVPHTIKTISDLNVVRIQFDVANRHIITDAHNET